ncbi:hypothetical protein [Brasilonema sennae]|uniref:hypothetical protein n=1 Tax=Brasilonema sennae TaxID=1397703 RepID=UPI0030DBB0D6
MKSSTNFLNRSFQSGTVFSFSLTPFRTLKHTGVLSKGSAFKEVAPSLFFYGMAWI